MVAGDIVRSVDSSSEPTLQLLMAKFLEHPDFKHGDGWATNTACLKRAEALMPAIRQMALTTRAREGQLSHAQLTGSSKYSSSWHQDQHVLAVRRAQSMLSGARASRQAAWFARQEKATGVCMLKDTSSNAHLRPLTQMRPPNENGLQVVLGNPKGSEPRLFAVLAVFRGAQVKANKQTTRKMAQQRPCAFALPWNAVAFVRLVPLTKVRWSNFLIRIARNNSKT